MGIIRGGLFVIATVLFFIGLLVANSLFVISSSLEYENIQEELTPVVGDTLEEEVGISEIVEETLPAIQAYCENNSEFVFNEQGQTFDISCESVEQGTDAIIDEAVEEFVEEVYYDEYDCGFFDCFSRDEMPFFLVSENTKNYFEGKLYTILPILLILLVAMFFLVESKTNLPIIVGILLIIAALPFVKLESLVSIIVSLPFWGFGVEILAFFSQFFTFLFTQSYFVFLVGLILGFIVLGIGITLKFFVVGFKVSDFFSKFGKKDKGISKEEVKEVVKEEVSREKSSKKEVAKEKVSEVKKKKK